MSHEAVDVYICYHDIDPVTDMRKFLVTIDLEEAKEYSPHYELATLKQLNNWLGATGEEWDDCLLHTKDGLCEFYVDDEIFEYRKLSDIKRDSQIANLQ